MLNIEATGIAANLDVWSKRKGDVKHESIVFSLSNWKKRIANS